MESKGVKLEIPFFHHHHHHLFHPPAVKAEEVTHLADMQIRRVVNGKRMESRKILN